MNTPRAHELKLAKLPDRSTVKLSIALAPALHAQLLAYAHLYHEVHGVAEPVTELVPYMLEKFLASDKGFARAKKNRATALPEK